MSAGTLGRRAGFQRGWRLAGTISESYLFIPWDRPFAILPILHQYSVHSWLLSSICLASQPYTFSLSKSNHLQMSTLKSTLFRIQINMDLSLLHHLQKLPVMPTILIVNQIPSADFTLVHSTNIYRAHSL